MRTTTPQPTPSGSRSRAGSNSSSPATLHAAASGDRGTGIFQTPSDSPEVQLHVAWDSANSLAMLPDTGDQLCKLTDDQDTVDEHATSPTEGRLHNPR